MQSKGYLPSRAVIASVLLGPAIAVAAPAAAQTAPDAVQPVAPPLAAAPSDTADTSDKEVVVTANRREETLQKTPVAVTAIPEALLRTSNLTDTRELARLAPSLGFTQGVGTRTSSFYVRGVGTFIASEGFDSSVGVAVDGLPAGRNATAFADLVDIERVEVLEGPQGMLFGKNATAGLVNVITRKPKLGETSFEGRFGYGNYDELQTTGVANLALGKGAAARITGWHFGHDGYADAPMLGRKIGRKDSNGVRASVALEPTPDLDILLTGQWGWAHNDPHVSTIRQFVSNANNIRSFELGLGLQPGPTNLVTNVRSPLFFNTTDDTYRAMLNYRVGGVTLTATTQYQKYFLDDYHDSQATAAPVQALQTETQRIAQFTQEFRVTSPADTRLKYVVGALYTTLTDHADSTVTQIGSFAATVRADSFITIKTRHYAAFGQLTYDLTPALRLIAGGRYSRDKITGALVRTIPAGQVILAGVNTAGAARGPINVASRTSDTEPSWRLGMQYDATPDVMLYGTVSHGYKAAGIDLGGSTTQAQFNLRQGKVDPERATNFEAGIRSRLFDRRLTFNATAFHERFTDFQITLVLPGPPLALLVLNANEMTSTGVSVQTNLRASKNLTLSGSAIYADTKFTDFPNGQCYPGQPVGAAGAGPGFCVGGLQDLKGKPLPNAPKWSLLGAIDYKHGIGGGLEMFGNANIRYQSSVVFNQNQDPNETQGGYSTVNLGFGVGNPDAGWSLRAYVNNAFKTHFVSKTFPFSAYYININTYQTVRTYGATLNFKF